MTTADEAHHDGAERCRECGDRHTDWTEAASRVVEGASHAGVVRHYECGRCGNTMEVTTV